MSMKITGWSILQSDNEMNLKGIEAGERNKVSY